MSKRRPPRGRQYHARRRKRVKFILNIFKIIIFVAAVYAILAFTPVLKMANVYVEGINIVTADEVLQKAAIPSDINILRINMGETEKRIEEIPYVADAKIKYKFPNNIRIVISEGSLYYAIKTEEGYVNTDENLKVLEITEMPKVYPVISELAIQNFLPGEKLTIDESEKFDIILLYREILQKHGVLENIDLMYVDNFNFKFRMKDGATVECGNVSDADRKVAAFKAALDSLLEESGEMPKTGSFDISDPHQVVYSID